MRNVAVFTPLEPNLCGTGSRGCAFQSGMRHIHIFFFTTTAFCRAWNRMPDVAREPTLLRRHGRDLQPPGHHEISFVLYTLILFFRCLLFVLPFDCLATSWAYDSTFLLWLEHRQSTLFWRSHRLAFGLGLGLLREMLKMLMLRERIYKK